MVRLHLVRHGRASAGWGDDPDPGLDEVGRLQAVDAAGELTGVGPLPILTSPMRRAQETAAPLATRWGGVPVVEPAVGEIPSPTPDLAERSVWLRSALRSTWADLGPDVVAWRSQLIATLLGTPGDTVVFTHFVAINAAVAAASRAEALIVFAPANASRTVIDVDGDTLTVVALGRQADTEVA